MQRLSLAVLGGDLLLPAVVSSMVGCEQWSNGNGAVDENRCRIQQGVMAPKDGTEWEREFTDDVSICTRRIRERSGDDNPTNHYKWAWAKKGCYFV